MDLPRLLATFTATTAFMALTASAAAQSITMDLFPDRDPGDTHSIAGKEYWVSYEDCVADDVFTFRVPLSGTANNNLEVWVSDSGEDCTDSTLRSGGTARCWQVYAADAANREMQVEIRAQDLARREDGGEVQGKGTKADCRQEIVSGGVNLTLHFLLISEDTVSDSKTFEKIGLDLEGPDPPSDVSARAGEDKLTATWSLDDPNDWTGYRLYCLPLDVNVSAPELRPLALGDGGAGGVSGNSGTGGASGSGTGGAIEGTGGSVSVEVESNGGGFAAGGAESTASPTSGIDSIPTQCRIAATDSNLLVPGELPSQTVIDNLQCGSGASDIATDGIAKGLRNGMTYQVAVAGIDPLGNIGPLSAVACGTPAEVDTFFEVYKEAGGDGGGGFCAMSGGRTPGFLSLLGGAALVFAMRRRRRQHG